MKADSIDQLKEAQSPTFKCYDRFITPDLEFLRPGSEFQRFPMNFTFTQGGMGDYICWTIALQWLVKNAPWIDGRIFAPAFFIDFVKHIFEGVPRWKVYDMQEWGKFAEQGSLMRSPNDQHPQFINAVGASLVDIGFAYFANLSPAPAGIHYPVINVDQTYLPKALKGKEKQYAVFTPGGTTLARAVRARHINPLIAHAKAMGLLPVFLGKHHLADVHNSYFDEGIRYEDGLDLREKTTILEAAAVMKYAAYTTGLDNGLLHLACCTDAPVVFGYNIAAPSQRRPIRHSGRIEEVILTKEELACIHCQTNVKLLCYHNFKNCLYKDMKCIDILYDNNGSRWKAAIERILHGTENGRTERESDFCAEKSPSILPERAA